MMMGIPLIKCIEDKSSVGVNELELNYHRPCWVFNNGDQTSNTVIVVVHVLVKLSFK